MSGHSSSVTFLYYFKPFSYSPISTRAGYKLNLPHPFSSIRPSSISTSFTGIATPDNHIAASPRTWGRRPSFKRVVKNDANVFGSWFYYWWDPQQRRMIHIDNCRCSLRRRFQQRNVHESIAAFDLMVLWILTWRRGRNWLELGERAVGVFYFVFYGNSARTALFSRSDL